MAWPLDSLSHRMWALRPNHFHLSFLPRLPPTLPPGVFPQLQEARDTGMQTGKGGRHTYTFTKGPLHTVSLTLGSVHTRTLTPLESPLAALACFTHVFGLRASLSGSLILLPPTLDSSSAGALGLGCTRGLLTLPSHLYSQPGLRPTSIHRPGCPHSPAPQSWMQTCTWTCTRRVTPQCSSIRPRVVLPMGPGSETNFLLRKGRQRVGADGKGLLQMAPIKLPWIGA